MAFNFPCPYCERPLKLRANLVIEGAMVAFCDHCNHSWYPNAGNPIIPFIEMCVESDYARKRKL